MTLFGYKSTETKLDRFGTLKLANRGLLCRSAYVKPEEGNPRWVPLVQTVQVGDRLCWWHRDGSRYRRVGSRIWEVVDSAGHPLETLVGSRVEGTALYTIDPAVIRAFDEFGGYQPDPHLGEYTGWLLRPTETPMPTYADQVPGRRSLIRLSSRPRGHDRASLS